MCLWKGVGGGNGLCCLPPNHLGTCSLTRTGEGRHVEGGGGQLVFFQELPGPKYPLGCWVAVDKCALDICSAGRVVCGHAFCSGGQTQPFSPGLALMLGTCPPSFSLAPVPGLPVPMQVPGSSLLPLPLLALAPQPTSWTFPTTTPREHGDGGGFGPETRDALDDAPPTL